MSGRPGLRRRRRSPAPGTRAGREGGERRAAAGRIAWCALLLAGALGAAPGAEGQEAISGAYVSGIELTSQTQQSLHRLEELWLQWFGAQLQRDTETASTLVDQLLATSGDLGLERLPDLAFGALVQAVSAAREGEHEHARAVLGQADLLDPGRPETAFAAADVAWLEGRYPGALLELLRGKLRLLTTSWARRQMLVDVGMWTLYVLLLAGGAFLLLQVVTKGGALLRDMVRIFARPLPTAVAHILAFILLLWPLVLPSGPLWLLLYWSVLLWGYGSASERVVWVVLWVLLGLAPTAVAVGRWQVELELAPPVQAMESVEQGRLYGALFTDLGVLRSLLADSVAVKHFLADLHRRLGQWDSARSLYLEVLAEEPENAEALINLGAYYFYTGDFGTAVDYFQRAGDADPQQAAAFFNLGQAYSEQYYFDESGQALARARELDDLKVSRWLQRIGDERILVNDAGIERRGEIRRQLVSRSRSGEAQGLRIELLRRGLSLLVAAGLVLTAVTLHLARRPFGYSDPPIDLRLSQGLGERLSRAFLPGLDSAEVGEGGRAYLAALVPVALLMLPLGGSLVYRLPLGYDGGRVLEWTVAVLGLIVFFGVRLVRELRNA